MIDGHKGQKGFRTLLKSQDEVIVRTLNKQCFSADPDLDIGGHMETNNNKKKV